MPNEDFTQLEKFLLSKIENIDKATELARQSMEKRLDGMNEFRDTLKDQAKEFATKTDLSFILKDIRELRDSKAKLEGKADQGTVNVALIVSAISLIASIIGLFIKFSGR